MGEAKEDNNLVEISPRPFGDLTDAREEQFLLDEMMNVADMKKQIRKLKLAIDEKKARNYNSVICEMKESISDRQDAVIDAYSEKVSELNEGFKTRKKDLYTKREVFERNIVSIQAEVANFKKESDQLRKDESVKAFIIEYNNLKNQFNDLTLKQSVAISEEEKASFQDSVNQKRAEIESYINEKIGNSSIARFYELSSNIDSKICLVNENRDSINKLCSHEILINEQYNENVDRAKEIRRNQLALVSQESGLLGLKRLIGRLKVRLGIGKNKSNKEIVAICDATSSIGKTIEIVRNNRNSLGNAILNMDNEACKGPTQAQIVNKLASILFKSYASQRAPETIMQAIVNNEPEERVS